VFGAQSNDWAGCFLEWEQMIKTYIGEENFALLSGTKFSTSTLLTQAVTALTLMDVMKSYFEYRTYGCAISKVRLLGTREDWVLLIERTK
jgi:hypothetical protein